MLGTLLALAKVAGIIAAWLAVYAGCLALVVLLVRALACAGDEAQKLVIVVIGAGLLLATASILSERYGADAPVCTQSRYYDDC